MLNTIATKVLIVDNNDSFTWNLVELVRRTGAAEAVVCSARAFDHSQIGSFDSIILSPGPGLPEEFPLLKELIYRYSGTIPILGICLGHQALALAFGAKLINLPQVRHGKSARVEILDHSGLFNGLPGSIEVGLYHSWAVSDEGFPQELTVSARDHQGVIMGLRHRSLSVEGVQFHPESYLTPEGLCIMRNWIEMVHG